MPDHILHSTSAHADASETKASRREFFVRLFTRLDRYILLKYLKTFLLALALIIVIVITFDLSENIDDFISHNAPLNKIVFDYYLNFIPSFVNLYSPLFIFISVLFFTSKMASNSEIVAVLGSGVSYWRMLRPYLYGSIIVAITVLMFSSYVIPVSNRTVADFKEHYVKRRLASYYTHLHFQSAPYTQVYVESYDVKQRRAERFRCESFTPHGQLLRREAADVISFDSSDGLWRCVGYFLRTIDDEGVEKLTYDPVAKVDLGIVPDDFDIKSHRIETMTTPELRQYIARERMRGTGVVKEAEIEYYQRLLNPFAIIIMTFIGVAIGSRKSRGGLGIHLAIGITTAFGFIVFMKATTVFAVNGNLSPFMAVLLPQFVFGIGAGILLYRTPK